MSKEKNKLLYEHFETHAITDFRDMLYKTVEKYKDRTAFKLKDKKDNIYKVTYNDFKLDVECLGTKLMSLGLTGKKIAVTGKNSYHWAVSYLAASIIGIVVPIDKELHVDSIINFLNVAESSAVISDTNILDNLSENKEAINNKNLIFIDMNSSNKYTNLETIISQGHELLDNNDTSFRDLPINPDDLHILLFTSGTTGNSKAVCLSHKNICSNIISTASIVKVDTSTSVLSILPLYHTYECTLGYLLILYAGGTVAYCEGLRYISQNIQEFKPSFILCVPLLLENVQKKIVKSLKQSLPKKYTENVEDIDIVDKLPFYLKTIVKLKIKKTLGGNLKTFIVGAAAANPETVEFFFKLGIKVLQGYGLTECSPLVAGNNDFQYKADSCGLPIPNVEYKINNPNEEGIGEIIVKGPNVMLGYYQDEEATNTVIRDGWFYTGDLGYMDKNEFLYITGRCKSVIVTKNGKNIYPEELEYFLNEEETIEEAIVFGRNEDNDDETYVHAKIFPNIDAIKTMLDKNIPTNEDVSKIISDIIKKINSKLPNYKHIKSFKIVDNEFEKTTTKKVKRFGKNIEK